MLFGIINIAGVFLATMALGYFVCVKASKEAGLLKALGLFLGTIIIVISFLVSLFIILIGSNKPTMMNRQSAPMGTRPMMPAPMMPRK